MSDSPDGISLARLLKVLVPIALIALAVRYAIPDFERTATEQLHANTLQQLLGTESPAPADAIEFVDADGDLVADAPDERVTPEKLVFSYIAGPEENNEEATWTDLVAALGEATGLPVEYAHFTTTADQLAAMARGEVHVAGLNTGSVPLGVKSAGFVPVCTLGRDDGSFGYTMTFIARADGPVSSIESLAGNKVVFTRPDSNSGFKAALVELLAEHDLQPERDYSWGFSFDHERSIRDTVAGEYDAAPVASDILERMTNDGEVEEDAYRVIFKSERFPPATIGFGHNLSDEVRAAITDTLMGFDWAGTSVAEKYGSAGLAKFVAVNYKDDWANVRRINDTVRNRRVSQ